MANTPPSLSYRLASLIVRSPPWLRHIEDWHVVGKGPPRMLPAVWPAGADRTMAYAFSPCQSPSNRDTSIMIVEALRILAIDRSKSPGDIPLSALWRRFGR